MDKLKNKRSSRNNAYTSRKKIATNDVFKHRGFTRRLSSDNDDLRKVDWVLHANRSKCVLQSKIRNKSATYMEATDRLTSLIRLGSMVPLRKTVVT